MKVQGVGKAFRSYKSEFDRILSWFGLGRGPKDENWVLKELSFEVYPGEAIGFVGRNGAGKSTLLKLITGTLLATEGQIEVNGNISAILELGMGFSQDLTGRQNVLHTAGLMGFSSEEIDQLMPAIEEFCEIGEYFDQPMRVYSSGMQMRVAFSVATARRPEILIVDEALSVGDAYFQHKSFNRIREFQKDGTTLLIVSHDRSAIQSLCSRAILLDSGSIVKDGAPEAVFDFYNALIADQQDNHSVSLSTTADGRVKTQSGTGEAIFTAIRLESTEGAPLETVAVGQRVVLKFEVAVRQDLETLVMGYGIRDRLGQVIFGTNTSLTKVPIKNCKADSKYSFGVEFDADLGPGSYSIQAALTSSETHLVNNYEWRDIALVFKVVNLDHSPFEGCSWLEPNITISEL